MGVNYPQVIRAYHSSSGEAMYTKPLTPKEIKRRQRLVKQAKDEYPNATKLEIAKLCGLTKKQLYRVELKSFGRKEPVPDWHEAREKPPKFKSITRQCAWCGRIITKDNSWHDNGYGPACVSCIHNMWR